MVRVVKKKNPERNWLCEKLFFSLGDLWFFSFSCCSFVLLEVTCLEPKDLVHGTLVEAIKGLGPLHCMGIGRAT